MTYLFASFAFSIRLMSFQKISLHSCFINENNYLYFICTLFYWINFFVYRRHTFLHNDTNQFFCFYCFLWLWTSWVFITLRIQEYIVCSVTQLCPTPFDPWTIQPTRLLCPWIFQYLILSLMVYFLFKALICSIIYFGRKSKAGIELNFL